MNKEELIQLVEQARKNRIISKQRYLALKRQIADKQVRSIRIVENELFTN